jgi:magnesium chelatase family protein
LLDRFDLRLAVHRPDPAELVSDHDGESTTAVSARVAAVRALSEERGAGSNARLADHELARLAPLNTAAARLLELSLRAGSLSARGMNRIRRVARTLADLDGREGVVPEEDVATALELRTDFAALGMAP